MKTGPEIRGLIAEEKFAKLLGDNLFSSTETENIMNHWDLGITFDVKGVRHTDEFGESDYHWVEIKGIDGRDGWLYGKADFIAFETKKYWIVVDREKLLEHTKRVAIKEWTTDKKPYYLYKREGREDLLMMIPTIELCYIGKMIEK